MNQSTPKLDDLRQRQQQLVAELENSVHAAEALRKVLLNTIVKARRLLEPSLNKPPGKPSSFYWRFKTRDFWTSFQLFDVRLKYISETFASAASAEQETVRILDTDDVNELEDHLIELEDILGKYKTYVDQRRDLLAFLELLDSADRLINLRLPIRHNVSEKYAEYLEALYSLRNGVARIQQSFKGILLAQGVSRIELQIGTYPPPETTRIAARADQGMGDNVVIEEIFAHGYMWREKLLRKADVIVVSNERK